MDDAGGGGGGSGVAYDDLHLKVDDVVQEAVYSELRLYGWSPDGSGNVVYTLSGNEGGSTTAPGPGRGYPTDVLDPKGYYMDQTGNGLDASATLGDVYRFWETEIPPIFEPFKGLPDPEGFQTLADEVRMALKQLATEGSTGDSKEADDSANIDYEANTTLGLADKVASRLTTWQGGAADSFATYLYLFKEVVGNQALACEVLRMTLLMEKEAWADLRNDALDFAEKAAQAYREADGIGGSDLKAILKIATSVNTILGWFPAYKPVSEATSKGLTVMTLFVDTFASKEKPKPNKLGAARFADILPKLKSHASELKETSRDVEGDIKQSLKNLEKVLEEAAPARSDGSKDQESFRLDRPDETYSADATSDFITPGVVVNVDTVRSAASMLEDDLAPEMTTAANSLHDADSATPWHRDHGSIGVGTSGCHNEYSSASYLLEREIRETAKEMEWAAEMLRAVAADLDNTDNDVSDDFDGVRSKMHKYDHSQQ